MVLFFGIKYLADLFTHESTDDAFITADVVSIAPRVAGQVAAVYVLDNQLVHSNDLLVEIDPSDYAIAVAQKESAAVSQLANFRTIVAAYELMRSKVATAEASPARPRPMRTPPGPPPTNAQADFNRAQDLVKQKTISDQEFDTTQAANTKAQADLKSAEDNVDEEASKVDEANKQLQAVYAEKDMAFSQLSEAQTNVAAAQASICPTRNFLRPRMAASPARRSRPAIILRSASS